MKTIDWLKTLEVPGGGLRGWPDGPTYPEIAGYLIPTLLQWDEKAFAERLANWLERIQNDDGSFNGVDGLKRAFDTAACMEGLFAAGRNPAAYRALEWLRANERLGETYMYRVYGLMGRDHSMPDSPPPQTRSHYWAYALEGAYLLGRLERLREELEKLPRGMQPYMVGGGDSDTCATAQIAKLRMLLGMDAGAEVTALRGLVDPDGSLPHDLTNKKKVAWAAKYYLDCEWLLRKGGYDDRWYVVREWQFQQHAINLLGWEAAHPFGISGCFRVRNDHEFLEEAVTSHIPYLDEAVIVLQPSDAETNRVAERLAKLGKVRVVTYPVAPVFITDQDWEGVPENSIRSFVYLSNWALSQCRYSWIARIEADVIALPTFGNIVERIRHEPDAKRLYGRVLLNLAGLQRDHISLDNPRNGGWDECVFPNHPDYHFIRKPRYEVLLNPHESECMGWSGLHMKRCKTDKIGWNGETYAPFTPESVADALRKFNAEHPYPASDNPLGEPCLFEYAPLLSA